MSAHAVPELVRFIMWPPLRHPSNRSIDRTGMVAFAVKFDQYSVVSAHSSTATMTMTAGSFYQILFELIDKFFDGVAISVTYPLNECFGSTKCIGCGLWHKTNRNVNSIFWWLQHSLILHGEQDAFESSSKANCGGLWSTKLRNQLIISTATK